MNFLGTLAGYFSFRGRISRAEFWRVFGFVALFAFIGGIIEGITGMRILKVLFISIIAWPVIALTVRRLHDTGRSGWWFFIGCIPFVGLIVLLYFLLQESVTEYQSEPVKSDVGITDFVKQSREAGKTDEEIRSVLLEKGWILAAIELGMKSIPNQDIIYSEKAPARGLRAWYWWVGGIVVVVIVLILVAVMTSYFIYKKEKVQPVVPSPESANTTVVDTLEKYTRPASTGDIEGKWEMIYQHNGEIIPENSPYIFPYQRFHFLSNGYVKVVASETPLDQVALVLWEHGPESTKYEFLKPGVLSITGEMGDKTSILAGVVTEDFPEALSADAPILKKGDLVFSYIASKEKSGVPSYYLLRYLRKIDTIQ